MSRRLRELKDKLIRKDYAKLGDSIVNCIFSMVLTLLTGRPTGVKVSNRALREAYRAVDLGFRIGLKGLPKGVYPEDIIEALVGVLWLEGRLNINDIIHAMYERVGERKPISEKELSIEFLKIILKDFT